MGTGEDRLWAPLGAIGTLAGVVVAVVAIVVAHDDARSADEPRPRATGTTTSAVPVTTTPADDALTGGDLLLFGALDRTRGGVVPTSCRHDVPPFPDLAFEAVISCDTTAPGLVRPLRLSRPASARDFSEYLTRATDGVATGASCGTDDAAVDDWILGDTHVGTLTCAFREYENLHEFVWFSPGSRIVGRVADSDRARVQRWWVEHAALVPR